MSKQKTEYATLPIASLKLDPANARKHSDENLAAIMGSLKSFGQQKPIVVTRDHIVIAGNGTIAGAKKLGWTHIQVRYTDLSGDAAKAFALADNRTAELADWDKPLLGQQLQELMDNGFDIGDIGFDPKDWLKDILPNTDGENGDESLSDETDDISKIKAEPRVSLGQIWKLGRHKLVCGDSGNRPLVHHVIAEESAHAIVTDPPYGLEFMGKSWDKGVPSMELWQTWFTRITPGAHVLSFSGTRTYHLMTVAIEQAGFEVRDMMQWLYGQGFPKSQDISKAIDKAAGAEREIIGSRVKAGDIKGANNFGAGRNEMGVKTTVEYTAPATDDAKKWSGWGTALKPANEPICLARKPLSESTIAKNVLKHGTGGLNIDDSRISYNGTYRSPYKSDGTQGGHVFKDALEWDGKGARPDDERESLGRFPSNVIFDEDAAKVLDEQSGITKGSEKPVINQRHEQYEGVHAGYGKGMFSKKIPGQVRSMGDSGGASRFFYVAKASKSDRGEENDHATVKPISLMKYLVRLVTPQHGTVLEPFCGSGTTLLACETEGFKCIAFELDPHHCDIIIARWEKLTGQQAELLN